MANTSSIRAGRAFVELFTDDSRLVRGLRRASRKVKAFGEQIKTIGRKMAELGAAITLPLAAATKVFAGFDDQMRTVQAVLGATGEQFERLTAKAKLLGRTTSYTAAQVAGGMVELARAGFDADEIDAAIGSMLSLARATGTDLAEATNIAAGALRAFGLAAGDSGRVADVLVATANNSAQTLTDLGEAMKYAAPVADAFGLTLEETAQAIGALANFSIKGSMAGTTLKNIMLQLSNPAIRKKIESLGVAVTDQAGKFRGLGSILTDLGKAMASMPSPQRLALMNELFGKRAVAGGIKLTASQFDRLNDAIANANGAADRTAKVMDSGIGGAMRRLWSAVEGTAIAVGEGLAPMLSSMAEWMTQAAGVVTTWIAQNQGLVVSLAKLAGLLLAGGAAFIGLGLSVKLAAGIFGLLAGAMALVLSPMGLVLSAVATLGIWLLKTTQAGGKALDWLGGRFRALADFAKQTLGGMADALAAGELVLAAKILWQSLRVAWLTGIEPLAKRWREFVFGARAWFVKLKHGLVDIWHKLVWALRTAWQGFVNWHQKTVEKTAGWIAKRMIEIEGLLDDSVDVDFAKKQVDMQVQASLKQIDADTAWDRRKNDEEYRKETAANAAAEKKELSEEGKRHAAQVDAAQKALAAARAERDALLKRAKDARARMEQDGGPGDPGELEKKLKSAAAKLPDMLANVDAAEDRGAHQAAGDISTSRAAIRALAGGIVGTKQRDPNEQVAKNTEDMKRALTEINGKIGENVVMFEP